MRIKMNKLLAILLAALMILPLASCAGVPEVGAPAEIEVVDSSNVATGKNGALDALTTANGTLSDLKINGVSISSYVVVYENKTYAKTLADTLIANIQTATGYTLTKQVSTASQKTNEILVGNTGRSIATSFYNEGVAQNYKKTGWIVSGGKIALLGSNDVTLTDTCNLFTETYLSDTNEVKDITSANTLQTTLRFREMGLPEKTTTKGVRVFCHNVLAGTQTAEQYEQGILSFRLMDADILCFQEYTATWDTYMKKYMSEMGYEAAVNVVSTASKGHMTPIFYRPSEVTFTGHSGYAQFDGAATCAATSPSAGCANNAFGFSWARFIDNSTDKDFVVFSIHMTHCSRGHNSVGTSYHDIFHKMDAKQLVNISNSLRSQFGQDLPIIIIGDHNMGVNSTPMSVLSLAGFDLARYFSEKTHNMDKTTYTDSPYQGPSTIQPYWIIDHAWFSGSVIANYYEIVVSPYVWRYTDHQAHLFEFTPQ